MRRTTVLPILLTMLLGLSVGWAVAGDLPQASQQKPLYVGLLIQENLPAVASDLNAYRDFIRALPAGSHVAIAYARPGTLQVLQPFTDDLELAATVVRPPLGGPSSSPGSPFLMAKDFLKRFPADDNTRNFLVFVSDGLDWNYGDFSPAASSNPYLNSAIKQAKKANVSVFSIFAPASVRASLGSWLVSAGQNALGYFSDETGGESFFTGSTYVSAQPFLKKIEGRMS